MLRNALKWAKSTSNGICADVVCIILHLRLLIFFMAYIGILTCSSHVDVQITFDFVLRHPYQVLQVRTISSLRAPEAVLFSRVELVLKT